MPKGPIPLRLSAALETDRAVVAINDDWVADRNNLRRRSLPDTQRLVSGHMQHADEQMVRLLALDEPLLLHHCQIAQQLGQLLRIEVRQVQVL